MGFVKNTNEAWSEETITGHVRDKKIMRREHKGVRAGLQRQVTERDAILNQNKSQIAKQGKLINFMMDKNVHQYETEYSMNKASYVF